jgi:hypothetical protein
MRSVAHGLAGSCKGGGWFGGRVEPIALGGRIVASDRTGPRLDSGTSAAGDCPLKVSPYGQEDMVKWLLPTMERTAESC